MGCTMEEDKPIHLVVRFSDKTTSVANTITLHNDVIDRYGAVWFGKIGRPLAPDRIKKFNIQVERNISTYLYLIQTIKRNYDIYRCTVAQMTRSLPENEEQLVPEYYSFRGIRQHIQFWVKLTDTSHIPSKDIMNFHVAKSGVNLSQSL